MATVTFEHATRIYQAGHRPAVDALDLEIARRRVPRARRSVGCGKSTTLRMLAGLEPIDDGSVFIGDRDVTMLPPRDRDIAMVFQSYALYPHMTVAENIGFHLKIKKVPRPRSPSVCARRPRAARPRRVPRPQAGQAVGRPAPARGDGPRHRAPAAGVPDGRAAVEPRRQAARADPHADRRAAAAPRRHHRVRHPRPGRGDDDGRPRRRAQGRRAAAVRLAPRAVHPSRQHVRRRLHRLAGDEPARRPRWTATVPSSAR